MGGRGLESQTHLDMVLAQTIKQFTSRINEIVSLKQINHVDSSGQSLHLLCEQVIMLYHEWLCIRFETY